MFGFFRSDSRASSSTTVVAPASREQASTVSHTLITTPSAPSVPCRKRRASSADSSYNQPASAISAKRVKSKSDSDFANANSHVPPTLCAGVNMDEARDLISHHFGVEVLTKHNELRLINQELAKCQVALEQLRRCHLIPYPQTCPTPDQMLSISGGAGASFTAQPGHDVAPWAPPFGVVDGPYSRHYAKWLIPDALFDGLEKTWQPGLEGMRPRGSYPDIRTTRNSFHESGASLKGRQMRGVPGQKLQALTTGYPVPKDKAGPCVLKRSDGKTVKLVCIDCQRENFSSTQGFINHCRIAHKRDFKSHEEAAVHSGQPMDSAERSSVPAEPKAPAASLSSAQVHPLARRDMSDQQAYSALCSRIDDSLKLYYAGKLPGVDHIPTLRSVSKTVAALPTVQSRPNGPLDGALDTPYLSRLLEKHTLSGCLRNLVADAKTKMALEDLMSQQESDESDSGSDGVEDDMPVRPPVVMRVPARSAKSPVAGAASSRPVMSKARLTEDTSMLPTPSIVMSSKHAPDAALSEEDMDIEDAKMSPSTSISNNAPSLVSDDGENDDSDEGSSVSGGSDNHIEEASMSDVAEISLDDDHDGRGLRRASGGVTGAVKLRKDDSKHVTFVGTIKTGTRQRRLRRVRAES